MYPDFNSIESSQLTWSHFKILLTVKSEEKRAVYEKLIANNQLSIQEFEALVKSDKAQASKGHLLPEFSGVPYLYRIAVKNKKLFLDLGFHMYIDYFSHELERFNSDSLVQVVKDGNTYTLYESEYDDSYLYTYMAYVVKIIDGDTVKVDIDLGFHSVTNQTLRLRGINAYEIGTRKGRKAKTFVVDALSNCDCIVIKTYHRDKYSRLLADVFYSYIMSP